MTNLYQRAEDANPGGRKKSIILLNLKEVGVEIGSALGAALAVSPLVTIIDSAIYKNAAGTQSLLRSLGSGLKDFLLSPVAYTRSLPVLVMVGVYGLTYATANLIDGLAMVNNFDPLYLKMSGTSLVNVSLCVSKDVLYTKLYGTGVKTRIPLSSLSLYISRDILTVCGTFGIPTIVAKGLTSYGMAPPIAVTVSQISVPCAAQLIATPMHILGIDLYNHPNSSFKRRIKFLLSEYAKNTLVKVMRTFFAFGLGGVANTQLRNYGYASIWNPSRHGLQK